eukprot:TRINITY_DN24011_c0_g1_i2.p1 TRINITY_DN24011_c0_g1~~TRINITY_DN24011_c0_g1_i2.p1  ORF type:complete len:784 (+),score=88.05 TRINITY_DN24011_c0_g1_i2:134-2485(+)
MSWLLERATRSKPLAGSLDLKDEEQKELAEITELYKKKFIAARQLRCDIGDIEAFRVLEDGSACYDDAYALVDGPSRPEGPRHLMLPAGSTIFGIGPNAQNYVKVGAIDLPHWIWSSPEIDRKTADFKECLGRRQREPVFLKYHNGKHYLLFQLERRYFRYEKPQSAADSAIQVYGIESYKLYELNGVYVPTGQISNGKQVYSSGGTNSLWYFNNRWCIGAAGPDGQPQSCETCRAYIKNVNGDLHDAPSEAWMGAETARGPDESGFWQQAGSGFGIGIALRGSGPTGHVTTMRLQDRDIVAGTYDGRCEIRVHRVKTAGDGWGKYLNRTTRLGAPSHLQRAGLVLLNKRATEQHLATNYVWSTLGGGEGNLKVYATTIDLYEGEEGRRCLPESVDRGMLDLRKKHSDPLVKEYNFDLNGKCYDTGEVGENIYFAKILTQDTFTNQLVEFLVTRVIMTVWDDGNSIAMAYRLAKQSDAAESGRPLLSIIGLLLTVIICARLARFKLSQRTIRKEWELFHGTRLARLLAYAKLSVLYYFRAPQFLVDSVRLAHCRGSGQGKFSGRWAGVRAFGATWLSQAHALCDNEAHYLPVYLAWIFRKLIGLVILCCQWSQSWEDGRVDRFMALTIAVKSVLLVFLCWQCWKLIRAKQSFHATCMTVWNKATGSSDEAQTGCSLAMHENDKWPPTKRNAWKLIMGHFSTSPRKGDLIEVHRWSIANDFFIPDIVPDPVNDAAEHSMVCYRVWNTILALTTLCYIAVSLDYVHGHLFAKSLPNLSSSFVKYV